MADTPTPEQKAAELLASVPHAADCSRDVGFYRFRCTCDRPIRAIIAARDLALEDALRKIRPPHPSTSRRETEGWNAAAAHYRIAIRSLKAKP